MHTMFKSRSPSVRCWSRNDFWSYVQTDPMFPLHHSRWNHPFDESEDWSTMCSICIVGNNCYHSKGATKYV